MPCCGLSGAESGGNVGVGDLEADKEELPPEGEAVAGGSFTTEEEGEKIIQPSNSSSTTASTIRVTLKFSLNLAEKFFISYQWSVNKS